MLKIINEEGRLKIEITDDGIGFENKTEYSGYGLLNMQKRAKKAGFALEIISSVGRGTKITIYNIEYSIHSNKII